MVANKTQMMYGIRYIPANPLTNLKLTMDAAPVRSIPIMQKKDSLRLCLRKKMNDHE